MLYDITYIILFISILVVILSLIDTFHLKATTFLESNTIL